MKVAVAQFIYESNTFNSKEAELACFRDQGVFLTESSAIETWARDSDSQLSGSLQVLRDSGCEVVPVFVAICGTPGGRLSVSCHDHLKQAFLTGLGSVSGVEAMLLHLHGAVCATGVDDVEGDWLRAIRETLGFGGPIVVSLDLHANVTSRMLQQVDAVTAYRTAPHIDFEETGKRAARILIELPETTSLSLAKIAGLFPPTATHHEREPFSLLLEKARQQEAAPEVIDVSLFPVQPWLDVEDLGSSVVVTTIEGGRGKHVARQLADSWYAGRRGWPTGLSRWETIIDRLRGPANDLLFLVDTADATTGGSSGSSSEAIRRLWPFRNEWEGLILLWVVSPKTINHTPNRAGETTIDLPELTLTGDIVFRGECRFRARGEAYQGQEVSCGNAVVLAAGNLRIVIAEQGCLCSDPAFYESVGLFPMEARAVHVKSLLGWQAGYGVGPERGLYFDGPGQTSLDFARLSFSPERRDLFPISPSPLNPVSLWQST
ncbi:MAG: M81 family metallopeptidase [Synoicihabitans sp.]